MLPLKGVSKAYNCTHYQKPFKSFRRLLAMAMIIESGYEMNDFTITILDQK